MSAISCGSLVTCRDLRPIGLSVSASSSSLNAGQMRKKERRASAVSFPFLSMFSDAALIDDNISNMDLPCPAHPYVIGVSGS